MALASRYTVHVLVYILTVRVDKSAGIATKNILILAGEAAPHKAGQL
jgi:hypothetical protein